MTFPVVAIVGRPNVGKSALFNRLAGRRIAIVDPTSGVTRDRVTATIEHRGRFFELTDTGGMGIDRHAALAADIERQIDEAMRQADLVLFVVDVRDGLVPLDHLAAERLRHLDKAVILVANKADTRPLALSAGEFFALGFGAPLTVSATEGLGRGDLLDAILDRLPAAGAEPPPEPVLKLAVVGRRNVGKSTFINALAHEERMIVSESPGTTRDAVDVRFEQDGRVFLAIDTAGVRRPASLANSIEFYGQARTERSIRRADVVLLMIDTTIEVGLLEKRLAAYVLEHLKPVVLVVNKWDLHEKATMAEFQRYLAGRLPALSFAPVVFTTAKSGRKVGAVIEAALALDRQARTRVTTGELNRLVADALRIRTPRPHRNRIGKVYYAAQVSVRPPTIVLRANDPRLFDGAYRRYLEAYLRERLPYSQVPLRLYWRARAAEKETGKAVAE